MNPPPIVRRPRRWILPTIIIVILLAAASWFMFGRTASSKTTYTTATVTTGTLVVSVSASGTTTATNRLPVTTAVTGTIAKVYVKDGATVTTGQTILKVTLDSDGQLALAKAKSSLLQAQSAVTQAQQGIQTAASDVTNAQNAVTQAQQQKLQLHQALLQAQSQATDAQTAFNAVASLGASDTQYQNKLLALQIAQDSLKLAQSKYTSADAAINQAKSNVTTVKQKSSTSGQLVTLAQANLAAAQQAYNDATGTVTASVSGTVADLTYAEGMQLSATSSGTTGAGAGSSTKVASIITGALPTASFTLAEADAPKILPGQKATLTFDAISDKTFIGTVVGIDRTGSVSSGVTTYPMTIQLDAADSSILPNMSVTADVITKTVDNVLLVPIAAVKSSTSGTAVQVMANNQPKTVSVEIGDSSDSQTVITTGLTEGQTVVTATITASTTNTSSSGTSLFGGTLRSGTGAVRVQSGTFTGGGPPN